MAGSCEGVACHGTRDSAAAMQVTGGLCAEPWCKHVGQPEGATLRRESLEPRDAGDPENMETARSLRREQSAAPADQCSCAVLSLWSSVTAAGEADTH